MHIAALLKLSKHLCGQAPSPIELFIQCKDKRDVNFPQISLNFVTVTFLNPFNSFYSTEQFVTTSTVQSSHFLRTAQTQHKLFTFHIEIKHASFQHQIQASMSHCSESTADRSRPNYQLFSHSPCSLDMPLLGSAIILMTFHTRAKTNHAENGTYLISFTGEEILMLFLLLRT